MVMMIAAALFMVSAIGSGTSSTSIEFIIFRLIGGLGVGAASVLCPVYISGPPVPGTHTLFRQSGLQSGSFLRPVKQGL